MNNRLESRLLELAEIQPDSLTKFDSVIDGDHRYIHDGKKFTVSLEQALLINGKYKISFMTPAFLVPHWRPALVSTSSSMVIVRIYEDVTSTLGTEVTPVNMNRHSTLVSTSTVKKDVTVDLSAETPFVIFSIGSGGGVQSRSAGSAGATEEIVLKNSTEYIIEIDEPNVAATNVYVELRWYEE